MKKIYVLIWIALLSMLFTMVTPNAALAATQTGIPYATYTFGYDGEVLESPHAYVPQTSITAAELGLDSLRGAKDLKVDSNGNLYIADTDHNRIVVMDSAGNLQSMFERFDNGGKEDTLSGPMGIFITQSDHLYISDTGNRRILEFDANRQLVRELTKPDSVLLPDNYNFSPSYLTVDTAGRMYVISEQTTYGIMVFNADGTFVSFLGAQKTSMGAMDLLWRKFMTKAQRENLEKNVPTNYSNLTIDEKGFVYATSIIADNYYALAAIRQRSTDSSYAMIKKFNSSGEEVLKRYGFYPPAGDVSAKDFSYSASSSAGDQTGASHMTAVTLGENGTYTLLDKKRNKIFTYDSEGNLLYAFGGTGIQQGLFSQISAGCYYGSDLFVLDATQGKITKFVRTDYGALLYETIAYNNNREYEKAVQNWEKVLQQNNGLCVANVGIGKAMIRLGNYEEAMSYFKKAHDVANYSKAYEYQRNAFLKSGYIFLIPVVVVVFILLLLKLSRKLRQVAIQTPDGKSHLSRELAYAQYVLFHPFDGVYSLKYEKRGSFTAALIIAFVAAVSMIVKDLVTGYIVDPTEGKGYDVFAHFGAIALVVVLFCIANWCVTTLMDGKGNLKDIFTVVGYSMTPLILFCIPAGLLSNYFAQSEAGFFSAFLIVGYVWCGFLLFFGILTVHEYSLGKSVIAFLLTLLAMIVILFIGILCINLFNKIFVFISNLYSEISLRF